MQNNTLELLHEIRTDTFRNAAPMPLRRTAKAEWQGLAFQIGGMRLVSPLGEVVEILDMPRIAQLPGVQSWVLGIANVRGSLLPIIDVHGFLGLTPTLPSSMWRVLLVDDGEVSAGLLVEQSLGLQHFAADSFEQSQPEGFPELQRFLRGAYRHGGRVYYQVELAAVLRDESFFAVADR